MRVFFMGLLVMAAVGCGGTCEVDGQLYRVGESFPAPDGCNTCTCHWGGDAACTEMGCIDDSGDTDTDDTDTDTDADAV